MICFRVISVTIQGESTKKVSPVGGGLAKKPFGVDLGHRSVDRGETGLNYGLDVASEHEEGTRVGDWESQ